MRAFDLLLHIQIDDSVDCRNILLNLIAQHKHAVQIIAEKFNGNTCLSTRKHSVDTVRNGLSNLDIHPRNHRQFFAYIGNDLGMRTVSQYKGGFYLGGIYAQSMFIEFGTSRLPGDSLYLGNFK